MLQSVHRTGDAVAAGVVASALCMPGVAFGSAADLQGKGFVGQVGRHVFSTGDVMQTLLVTSSAKILTLWGVMLNSCSTAADDPGGATLHCKIQLGVQHVWLLMSLHTAWSLH